MALLIWVEWVTKNAGSLKSEVRKQIRLNSPVSAKGRDFYSNYSLTSKKWSMKKVIESLRLNEFIYLIKEWMKKNRKNDDDMFDHPFAIF
jgi:hypothetical protein